ncbi:MAG: primosomal protein N' [Thermoguttaceae bacterium]|nr:primosomal protein N' [Thermoguttaceae bacterium]
MQPTLFDDQRPVWETVENEREILIAEVAFPDGPDGTFDYKVPERLEERVVPGVRVTVPLGTRNRPVCAYCVGVERRLEREKRPALGEKSADKKNGQVRKEGATDEKKRFRLKEVASVVDAEPLLSPKMLELARWLAKRYLCPLGTTLEGILPAGVRDAATGTRLTTVLTLAPDFEARLAKVDAAKKKRQVDLLTPKQRFVLETLRQLEDPPTVAELARCAKCSTIPIIALKNLGIFQTKRVRRTSRFLDEALATGKKGENGDYDGARLTLTDDQRKALDRILTALREEQAPTFLLHGATGSGKTEVYIRAIEEVVSYRKQAIVLVPEISLTPQTVGRFRERFGDVAVLHSRLTDVERKAEWEKIASGRARVVVGARSAVFAPVPRLGLIVIDEEHETSFKQDVAPRYHARVVARFRADQENVPLLLGSATPSLESWRNAQMKRYELLTLPRRVCERPLPPVHIVDMRSRVATGFARGSICQRLFKEMTDALDADPTNQIVLLLNRRGFSTHIQCPSCGETLKCPECDVALTHHITQQIALCHYCDYQIPAPNACPYCGFAGIKYGGFGTQKLERELAARFPDVPILRMDADTTQARDAHERALGAFRSGEYRILLGTQMIAKGLDFPNVVLVGIINADAALHLPDFRASERTFYLIVQASGRAGRGEKEGKVVVQTYNPEHPAIRAAMAADYLGFAREELAERRKFGYPPFFSAIRFVVRGPDERETAEFAKTLGAELRAACRAVNEELGFVPPERRAPSTDDEDAERTTRDAAGRNVVTLEPRRRPPLLAKTLGPAPAPFAKLRGEYRFHLQTIGSPGELLREAARRVVDSKPKAPRDVRWIVDVDPLEML